ncbi:Aspartate aminotransferase [Roseibacterium elongatum DSM 19469]|uniref:Aminotransferase n=1 Tax=Roseicyclus elongatus DSM 19469 TaxID=1294273 RepID=W8RRD1_9RHOB|nr:amino acid aminotransferase [Roseibacterium elongatum]AHM03643.1 Aspartate aminotransferase [Roseibacterium elongatum DSM 19469]
MFETLTPPPQDRIIDIMGLYAADARPEKVDLGVGVYRTEGGRTPVMAAVKAAEARILQAQESKGYVALAGDAGFHAAMRGLILGDAVTPERVAACATPGGTGAIRQVLEMVQRLTPQARIWVPSPSWPNHAAIIGHLGLTQVDYRYYDVDAGGVDRDGMLADLAGAKRGDIVLLHGCCHNPTGADLAAPDWVDLADVFAATGAIPFVDIAYQGFGDGLDEDAAGLRSLAARVPEMLIAASCSKNFGLYRERVGIVLAVTDLGQARAAAAAMLAHLNRQSYAFPPDHGARVVETILTDAELTAQWRAELDAMRTRMTANRRTLAEALRAETGSDRFGFVAAQRGMFSLLPVTEAQVAQLREDHAIYLVSDGRMNVAGLTAETIPRVARAIAQVLA